MASRSVRKIWTVFVAVLVAVFLLYFVSSQIEYSGNSDVSYSPNILVDNTLYWYVAAYPLSEIPEGLTSIGKVSKNISGISSEDFIKTGAASGIGIGAEVFAGNNYPYQLYIQWGDNLSFFTIEPLSFPLIRYHGDLYIKVQSYQDSGYFSDYPNISPASFSPDFSYAGSLRSAEIGCIVPMNELESNYEFYSGGDVYSNANDLSTIFVNASGDRQEMMAFYNVSLIPLDYSEYEP